jgi:hypothetical protein
MYYLAADRISNCKQKEKKQDASDTTADNT